MAKKKLLTPAIFCFLTAIFVVLISINFIPAVGELFYGPAFLVLIVTFFIFGLTLVISTIKEKIKGKLKKFLILTGASAVGFFLGVLLHNFFYALAIIVQNIAPLHYLIEILHVVFFITGTLICPIGFLIGTVASIIFYMNQENH